MNTKNIFVRHNGDIKRVDVDEILFITANGDYCKMTTTKSYNDFMVHTSLNNFLKQLPQNDFVQIHRSHAININKLDMVQLKNVLVDAKFVPIGEKYRKQLIEKLNIIKQK